jgi:predicted PurR-regulated permease PerM
MYTDERPKPDRDMIKLSVIIAGRDMLTKTDRHETLDVLLRGFALLAFGVIIVWGFIQAKEFLLPVTIAALLAMLMTPLVHVFRRWQIREGLAVAMAAAVLLVPLIALGALALLETESLVHNWPQVSASAHNALESALHSPLAQRFGIADHFDLASLQSEVADRAGEGASVFLAALHAFLKASSHLILILAFAIIMLASRVHLRKSFEVILSTEESPERAKVLDHSLDILEKFLLARGAIVLVVAVADFIILKLFGMPYSVSLAMLLGVVTLLPVIGFFVGVIPALIVATAHGFSPLAIGGVFVSVGIVSTLQDHLLTPKLIGEKLNLNFLATYLALFAGERIWGISGMFLSIPALGLLRVVLSASKDLRPWAILLQGRHEPHHKLPS